MPGDKSAEATDAEIRHLIEERGLSVAEVAEEVGMPEAVIDEWVSRQSESGRGSAEEDTEPTAGHRWPDVED